MLNKLLEFVRKYEMLSSGDKVVCAVSGGADSVALLWALYLLREKLQIQLEAAHFNHHLRGAESNRDAEFVKKLCERFDIPLHLGEGEVVSGAKGLEAAAREARYNFFSQLEGKIATAHTADDNAETVMMHLIRGTGLNGLCGITPVTQKLIRPMLAVTRADVIAFLKEYNLTYVCDSSNATDDFLRNRLRHHVVPLLVAENPRFATSVSDMALRLRQDQQELDLLAQSAKTLEVERLRELPDALRSRVLTAVLEEFGVKEPSSQHISLLERVVFSQKPSARGEFPGGVVVARNYGRLELQEKADPVYAQLPCPGTYVLADLGVKITCKPAQKAAYNKDCFTVAVNGTLVVRSRREGDMIRLPGGTKSLKKLFIDLKIPAAQRPLVPVLADDKGVVGVYGIGANLDRITDDSGVQICLEKIEN